MAPLPSLSTTVTPHDLSSGVEKLSIVDQPPVIDISQLRGSDRQHVVEAIGRAAHEWGFFQVINHGVSKPIIERMWAAYDELYALPRSERAHCDAQVIPQKVLDKFAQLNIELPKAKPGETNSRDTMRFWKFDPDQADAINHAPEFFRGRALEYYKTLRGLGEEILGALSESMGLDTDHVYKLTGQNSKVNTSIHLYSPEPGDPIGLISHTDIDTLTVLLQDETNGLQVLKDGKWVDVKPLPDSFIVNIGEAMQIITNGNYRSVMHRVINNAHEWRRSVSCFLCPTDEATFGPLPQFVSQDNPPRYKHDTFLNHICDYFSKAFTK